MNKIIIAVVAIIVIAGTVFVSSKDDTQNTSSSDQASTNQTSSDKPKTEAPQKELDPNNYTAGANIGAAVINIDSSEVKISIDDNIFKTTYLKIKKGTKVTWTNDGNLKHDVTSSESSPNKGLGSELLGNGETYEFTFDSAGVYEYFCTPHANEMKAVITVVD
ncbi:MAG TPA: plastocyanin/azurin family copper-binding protein [Patescibacteria group bacterium]|nr:plastocyanin/azurin family copper-binding protein [Patescibacteria group bacterium]